MRYKIENRYGEDFVADKIELGDAMNAVAELDEIKVSHDIDLIDDRETHRI